MTFDSRVPVCDRERVGKASRYAGSRLLVKIESVDANLPWMPEEKDMRYFYTLLVSGLLIFHEVPIDQPPPATGDDVPYGAASSILSGLGVPGYHFSTQYKPNFSTQYKIEKEPSRVGASGSRQEVPDQSPDVTKATVTPMPKGTTADMALATYRQQSELPVSGYAMFYNPNVMQEVIDNRLAMGHISACPECIGSVALLRAGDLNRRVWLEWADGTVEGPFLVADTAAQHHVAQLLARHWVVDVDHRTALRRGMAGPMLVTVWGSPPSVQADTPPFMPLYPATPTAAATIMPHASLTPAPTPLPALDSAPYMAAPYTELVTKPADAAANSARPTVTPPSTGAPLLAVDRNRGFPPDTPVPTVTPLPVIVTTPSTLVPPDEVPPHEVYTPMALLETTAPTATMAPSATPTLAPTWTATTLPAIAPTFTPTLAAIPSSTPDAGEVVTATTIVHAFPDDTPIPTVTPLPFITSTPTPPA